MVPEVHLGTGCGAYGNLVKCLEGWQGGDICECEVMVTAMVLKGEHVALT